MSRESVVQNQPQPPALSPLRGGILQRKCACGQHTVAGGDCAECRKKRLQRKSAGHTEPETVPPIVHEVLRSPGQPLDGETRAFMEPRFGHDFSQVRVHTDAKAAESVRVVNALAYTVGRDVVFGSGQYTPGTTPGRKLLAHELAHVVQSEGTAPESQVLTIGQASCAREGEAVQATARVMVGKHVSVRRGSAHMIFRQEDPRHIRGYYGEQEMAFRGYRFEEGWMIIEGPSGVAGHGVTQSGFDAVAYNVRTGELHIIDNKSFARVGRVSSATAIDPGANLLRNIENTIQRVEAMSPEQMPERQRVLRLLRQTRTALRGRGRIPGRVRLVVTAAGGRSTGVTARLRRAGVIFRDLSTPETSRPGTARPSLEGGRGGRIRSRSGTARRSLEGGRGGRIRPRSGTVRPSLEGGRGGRIRPTLRGVAGGLAGAALALFGGWLRQRVDESLFDHDMERIEPQINHRLDMLVNEIADIQMSQGAATVPVYAVITIVTQYHHHREPEVIGPVQFSVYGGTQLVSVTVSDSPRDDRHETPGEWQALRSLRIDRYTVTYSVPLEPFTADQLRTLLLHRIEEIEQTTGSISQDAEQLRMSQIERDQLTHRLELL